MSTIDLVKEIYCTGEEDRMQFRKIIKRGSILVISVIFAWVGISNGLTAYEKSQNKAPGQMVEVDGEKMHVYMQGEGSHTIVLMSGLGTVSPVLDYEPLIQALSKNNKVVVVEPFGYGWSDQTSKARTAQNMVEELRQALVEAGITEPVTLMPHSISGLYAMYYANTYPEEVEAVIGIDCTLPKMCHYFGEEEPSMPSFMQYLAPLGIFRLDVTFRPEDAYPTSGLENYSKENLELTKRMTAWQVYNKDVEMEADAVQENMAVTFDMTFHKDLPVLIFAAENKNVTEDGKTNESFYQMYLDGLDHGKLMILKGKHYLHHTCADEMAEEAEAFLEEVKISDDQDIS